MPKLGDAVEVMGVEVLYPGTWNGVTLSRRDLEEMVQAFEETGEQLPVNIQLGHDARQAFAKAVFGPDWKAAAEDEEGWPALGWATRLYLQGDRLMADVAGVPHRLAQWVREKRYRTRSGGLRYNRTINGKVYRWAVDHIAILGAKTPAVPGLADIGLSGSDVEVTIEFEASEGDGLLLGREENARDAWLTRLQTTFDEGADLIFSRRGVTMARQVFAAAMAKLRETARVELPLSEGENEMSFSLEGLRGLLNLGDAEASDVVSALNKADKETAGKVLELAASLGIKSADQLVAALAVMLGVAVTDFDGIAARVMESVGVDAPTPAPADPAAPAPAPEPPEGNMSAKNDAPDAGMVELSQKIIELAAANKKLQERLDTREAEEAVDLAAQGLGIDLPKPARDTLVKLSASGDQTWKDLLPTIKSVPTQEKGTADAPETITLSDADKLAADALGIPHDVFLAQKARDLGVELPATNKESK